ncbi:DUF6660 family protein [Chryseobacterium sp. SNU WT5]|uniref:DUF6660 family protein n=1 Tax=Chryseobacterium sp. SNU WT5 TaxID=2594269 RepID=UPI0039776F8B
MKIVALVLSLFFAILITVSCNDGISPFSNVSSTSIKKSEVFSHPSDLDACSVFCPCACCGIVMVFEKINLQIKDSTEINHNSKIVDFQLFTISKIPFGIWQPPKLC